MERKYILTRQIKNNFPLMRPFQEKLESSLVSPFDIPVAGKVHTQVGKSLFVRHNRDSGHGVVARMTSVFQL